MSTYFNKNMIFINFIAKKELEFYTDDSLIKYQYKRWFAKFVCSDSDVPDSG